MQAGPGSRDVTETSVGTIKNRGCESSLFFYGPHEHNTNVLRAHLLGRTDESRSGVISS
jgi:hypothetical protein